MSDYAICFDNVSKRYQLGGYHFANLWHLLACSGRSNLDRVADQLWALRNVTFHVNCGECVGIIGPNGSGKSTILKLLSRITRPTTGRVHASGRLGALLEVGAGFHHDLTGRENIYMNGVILGMSRHEINRKFDKIVGFSGVEQFIDTPIKWYSSGMNVRLGFAIAAHLEPEVLLIDEVLAVGDLEFQGRCLSKIAELKQVGTTIVFVSHQMQWVTTICDRALLLLNGSVCANGMPPEVIDRYRSQFGVGSLAPKRICFGPAEIAAVDFIRSDGKAARQFCVGDEVLVRVRYVSQRPIHNPVFEVGIYASNGTLCCGFRTDADGLRTGTISGHGAINLAISQLNLKPDAYYVSVNILQEDGIAFIDRHIRSYSFQIVGGDQVAGFCHLPHVWKSMA